ncbi:MAG: acetyl-CoA hydrolase/transferase family protein [Dehalococcoidia bacterium]
MDWQEHYRSRTVSPSEAVSHVKSDDIVAIPIFPPVTLLPALWERRAELRNVTLRLLAPSTDPGWLQPEAAEHFNIEYEIYIGDFGRPAMDSRRATFIPNLFSLGFKMWDERPNFKQKADVAIVKVSPPNKNGYVHFGPHHWTKRDYVRRAPLVLAEVDASLEHVHGDVHVHVSEIDYFTPYAPTEFTREQFEALLQGQPPDRAAEFRQIAEQVNVNRLAPLAGVINAVSPQDIRNFLGLTEPPEYARTIAGYLADLVPDRSTIQIGTGEPGRMMPNLGVFDNKHDLGLHTELGSPGYGRLVEAGVINGKYKSIHPGKAVAAAWTGCDDKDLEFIDDNPQFQLFDPSYVLALRTLSQIDNYVTINNGISVDLIGQVNSESVFGGRMINGNGGQVELAIAGAASRGGRSIILLPATALAGSVSRIVPQLEQGAMVTVVRHFADLIVTEFGVASLMGKSHRQRAEELISIAHPDFRAELRREAERLWWA